MKNKLILGLIVFSFLTIGNHALASTTNGTIDSTYHYAWGENVGWVDFANIHITDSGLSGSVYGENIGWIDLSTITNTSSGVLSGYAWGENVGWVDFSHTTIGTDGVFTGGAYGENIGWITFGTGDNKVLTDWRPSSARPVSSSGGGGINYGCKDPTATNYSAFVSSKPELCQYANSTTTTSTPISTPPPITLCNTGDKFSSTTGLPCTPNQSLRLGTGQASSSCTLTLTLRQGSKGEQVKCLQTKLHILSDGMFGPKTKATVIVFQKLHNLVTDGIVGPITRSKLLVPLEIH